jgi:hypothetical protein
MGFFLRACRINRFGLIHLNFHGDVHSFGTRALPHPHPGYPLEGKGEKGRPSSPGEDTIHAGWFLPLRRERADNLF